MNTSRVRKTKALQCVADAGPLGYQHGLAERTGCVRYGNDEKFRSCTETIGTKLTDTRTVSFDSIPISFLAQQRSHSFKG